jgi:MOB kinase activator 1
MTRRPSLPSLVRRHGHHFVSLGLTQQPSGHDFPPSFPATIKHVYRQLLRVFAHIYHAHYSQILHLRSEPHFNSLFAHFLAFGREYELLDVKDVRGTPGQPAVGIGALWERWKEMGILEG